MVAQICASVNFIVFPVVVASPVTDLYLIERTRINDTDQTIFARRACPRVNQHVSDIV